MIYRVYAGLATGDELKPWRPHLTEDELWEEPIPTRPPPEDLPDIPVDF